LPVAVGGGRAWLASRWSLASVDLVGAMLLFIKHLLEGFRHLHQLGPLMMKMPASCWRSRPFSQSRPLWPDVMVIPSISVGRWLCPWPTQIVIPTTLAPKLAKSHGLAWGFGGFYSSPKLTGIHRSPRISCPAWRSSFLRPSLRELCQPSRDVPAPGLNWLRAVSQPLAGAWLLGT
jgi:hypothetical protein